MNVESWTTRQRWLYAIKPASWPKLLVPMALGQAVGVLAGGGVSLGALLFGLVFTILDGLFIVLMNDWSDEEVDRIKRRMFPDGCSPKTIPDGILSSRAVLAGGLAAALAAVAAGFVAGRLLELEHLAVGVVICLGIFVAYSLPPLRLNYRGGGELLEMLGVGLALPWINAYAQSGELWAPSYTLFGGFAAMALASALASGLSDEESDRRGGKRTFATLCGNDWVRRWVEIMVGAGLGLWFLAGIRGDAPIWAVGLAAAAVGVHLYRLIDVSPDAVTNAFAELKVYKMHLHHAIWSGGLALAAGLVAQYLLG